MWVCDLSISLSLSLSLSHTHTHTHTHVHTSTHINTLLEGRRNSSEMSLKISVVDSDRLSCDTVLQECVVTCEDQGVDLIYR
jgi:hypothetical protein